MKVGEDGDFLIVCLYVDDLIYSGTNLKMVQDFERAIMKKLEMFDLGLMKYFCGFQVKKARREIFLSRKICSGPAEKVSHVILQSSVYSNGS